MCGPTKVELSCIAMFIALAASVIMPKIVPLLRAMFTAL
jgi:hypothetical protein